MFKLRASTRPSSAMRRPACAPSHPAALLFAPGSDRMWESTKIKGCNVRQTLELNTCASTTGASVSTTMLVSDSRRALQPEWEHHTSSETVVSTCASPVWGPPPVSATTHLLTQQVPREPARGLGCTLCTQEPSVTPWHHLGPQSPGGERPWVLPGLSSPCPKYLKKSQENNKRETENNTNGRLKS